VNRKVFYVRCTKACRHGGVHFHPGDVRKFYSALKAKHFVEKAPEGCFESDGNSDRRPPREEEK
jgi:hypothetical protein